MSPRAACRLEALGFDQVYDYTAGIADWKAAGLPTEGNADSVQQVLGATRTDIPTCQPGERIVDVRGRTFAAGATRPPSRLIAPEWLVRRALASVLLPQQSLRCQLDRCLELLCLKPITQHNRTQLR